jgi:hypothetical protein
MVGTSESLLEESEDLFELLFEFVKEIFDLF